MKATRSIFILTLALSWSIHAETPGPQVPAPERLPLTISLPDATVPIWIDQSVALDENGRPNALLLGRTAPWLARLMREAVPETCTEMGEVFVMHAGPPDRHSLDTAIRNSPIALLGTVTGKSYGFHAGVPGQLVQVSPERFFNTAGTTSTYYYFFIPAGTFSVGPLRICKTDSRYAHPPDIGTDVLLFVNPPLDSGGQLLKVYGPGDIVTFDGDRPQFPDTFVADKAVAHTIGLFTKAGLISYVESSRTRRITQ